MPIYTCEFCNKSLSTVSALNYHKKMTKYCIKIQNKIQQDRDKENILNEKITEYKTLINQSIDYRSENTLIKNNLQKIKIKYNKVKKEYNNYKFEQKTKYEKQCYAYDILEKEYKELKDKYHSSFDKLASKPTTNNTHKNTININIFAKSEEDIQMIIEDNMCIETIENGLKGIAELSVDKIFKDDIGTQLITVTDKSRMNIKYKNKEGQIVTDKSMKGLSDIILPKIKDKLRVMCSNIYEERPDIMDVESKLCQGSNEIRECDSNDYAKEVIRVM